MPAGEYRCSRGQGDEANRGDNPAGFTAESARNAVGGDGSIRVSGSGIAVEAICRRHAAIRNGVTAVGTAGAGTKLAAMIVADATPGQSNNDRLISRRIRVPIHFRRFVPSQWGSARGRRETEPDQLSQRDRHPPQMRGNPPKPNAQRDCYTPGDPADRLDRQTTLSCLDFDSARHYALCLDPLHPSKVFSV